MSTPVAPPRVFQWCLRVKGETSLPQEIPLGSVATVFGRDQAQVNIALRDTAVSRRHAEVRIDPDGAAVLRDLNSSNGTFVNGLQIVGTSSLRPGDEITIGRWSFEVQRVETEAKVYKNRLPGMYDPEKSASVGKAKDLASELAQAA